MVTGFRLIVLAKMEELEKSSLVRLVTPMQLAKALGKKPGNVRMLLIRLMRAGLVERPYHGGYRLTKRGRKVIMEARPDERRN